MKNITFMIGNGFDRHLGLDTGYDQFLKWYIEQPSPSTIIQNYKRDLKENQSSPWWSDAEIAMGEYAKNFTSKTIGQYFEIIRDFKIRLLEYLNIQENRCDFSDTKAISRGFESFLLNFHKDILLPEKARQIWSNVKPVNFIFLTFNYTRILSNIFNITKEATNDGRIGISPSDPDSSPYGYLGGILAVHGTLDSQIVMGVDDISQIALVSPDISGKMRRIMVKAETNRAVGNTTPSMAEQVIDHSDVIAIFGLKLGDTDATWRNKIGDWLKYRPENTVVIFKHDTLDHVNPHIPDDTLSYVEEQQSAFLNNVFPPLTEEELDELREKVFVISKTNHLNLNILR